MNRKPHIIVIGSGIAGLNFAIQAAENYRVTLITKKQLSESNTNYAQGGIAAVTEKNDYQAHIDDTIKTGSSHNNKTAVEFMIKNSTQAVQRLQTLGVQFANEKGVLKLTKEGGHSTNRILYVGDQTGQAIESTLVKNIKKNSDIKILENCLALDLKIEQEKCTGIKVLYRKQVFELSANIVVIASGGAGQLYSATTNPSIATGDGLAMAIRAGVNTEDLEFIQFHPTAFAKKLSPRFLLSEALRGEGAKLVNSKGEEFMHKYSKDKELAPRDLVARAIYEELDNGPVYLTMRGHSSRKLQQRFPKIYKTLEKHGYKLEKDLIPVTPAAHYLCGGIKTNLKGETSMKNLLAFGEVTCTGVHGANRLASNSLLEALVFSNVVPSPPKINSNIPLTSDLKILKNEKVSPSSSPETKMAKTMTKEIQNLMWQHAGIVRNLNTVKNLALPRIKAINKELAKIKSTNSKIAEAKNLALVAHHILTAILSRPKSLGCHFVK